MPVRLSPSTRPLPAMGAQQVATLSARVTSMAQIEAITAALVKKSFPELADSPLRFKPMKGTDFFFEVKVSTQRLLAPKGRGPLIVRVNPLALDGTLSLRATEAVLAHELSHLARLDDQGARALLEGAWANSAGRVLNHGKALKSVERRTDLDAIFRGYADGLIEYRNWQYARLDRQALAKKKATYLTPNEISAIAKGVAENAALKAKWWKHPPLSLAQIERDVGGGRTSNPRTGR